MAKPPDDINDIRKTLQNAGATSLETTGNEKLGELTPDSPIMAYVQGLEDQLAAVHKEGTNLLDHDVRMDEKTIAADVAPEHGLEK
jgi:hypothetical protein